MKIHFLGATQTVTGSKYLLEYNNKKILIDCGLYQGEKELRLRNWEKFPVNPSQIDAVLLTHAHIDHSGYIPMLVKKGFTGPIYATAATCELCGILLPDSGFLHEQDAKRANKYHYTKHTPALPLYTEKEAEKSLKQFENVDYEIAYDVCDNLKVTWLNAGHILGASILQLEAEGKVIVFTGDLGRPNDPIMTAPEPIIGCDYLITESTYGDRTHELSDPKDEIASTINKVVQKGGSILIPAFAVGRCQTILHYITELIKEGRIPNIPVYLDSPMAVSATDIFIKYQHLHKLTTKQCQAFGESVKYVKDVEESKEVMKSSYPKVIISASGMMSGGRVLHHLKQILPNKRNTLILVGFQASGTRGDRLLKGENKLKIHGKFYPVNCDVDTIMSMSAHADYNEIISWLDQFQKMPRHVFITHGELHAAQSLKHKIEKQLGWDCSIPDYLQSVDLS